MSIWDMIFGKGTGKTVKKTAKLMKAAAPKAKPVKAASSTALGPTPGRSYPTPHETP